MESGKTRTYILPPLPKVQAPTVIQVEPQPQDMTGFAAFHLLSSFLSTRLDGRWTEVWAWVRSVEYAGWFMAYVYLVPVLGYLPMTMGFAVLLGLRAGYRSAKVLRTLAALGVVIVIVFKGFLEVKIPGAAVYEYLPTAMRSFFLTYL